MSEADGPTRKDQPTDPRSPIKLPSPEATGETSPRDDQGTLDPSHSASHCPTAPGAKRAQSSEPKTIGPYRLVRKLGEGGMGQVWLAEQTAPLERLVAIKLIRAGFADGVLLERFESERQSLARMNHPAIAKVFDAGATAEGVPYFVMEYVPGIPITLYCDQKRLNIRQRIELFNKVCEGVQHAHQKAVIHRDLKPANILVTEIDGQAAPRIIDFGIAKAVSERDSMATMVTRAGNFVGTPAYMSPEQADPDIQDVDTRSDVYSLAVILYELLTGALPFDPSQWRSEVMHESLRRLREEDPPLPSIQYRNQATTERETAALTAKLRSTEPQQLEGELRGDLDWITMKALEKDRARRYGAPSDLAADLDRYLHHMPVEARPASAAYRVQKYVRRHRAAVAVASALGVLLVAFAVLQTIQLRRITRERDRANRISDFMTRMFRVSDPGETRGNTVTAREILDKASAEIETGLASDPEQQARLMFTMGKVYLSLGLDARAQSLLQRAFDIQRQALGPTSPETLETAARLGTALRYLGHYPESEKLERDTLESQKRVLGAENPKALSTAGDLAATLFDEGHYPEAEKLQRETLQSQRHALGPENQQTLLSMRDLGATLRKEGQYDEAERLQREVLTIQTRTIGADHPDTLRTMNSLANTVLQSGHLADAERLYRQVLESRRRVESPEHPDILMAMGNLANALSEEGHYAEAAKLQRENLEIVSRQSGPEHPQTLRAMENLSFTLSDEHQFAESEKLQRDMIAIGQRVLGPEHSEVLRARNGLAQNLLREGKFAEAEKIQRETLEIERRVLGPEKPETLEAMDTLGAIFEGEGHYTDAEKLQRETLGIVTRVFGPAHPNTLSVLSNLGETVGKEGRYSEEEELERTVLAQVRKTFGTDSPQTLNALEALALCLSYQKRYDQAKPLFAEAVQTAGRIQQPDATSSAWYNAASGAAIAGHTTDALDDLRRAIDAGFSDAERMAKDRQLTSLRTSEPFKALLEQARKKRAAAPQKPD